MNKKRNTLRLEVDTAAAASVGRSRYRLAAASVAQ